jgi:phosphoenolpyruvate---glycerone phosphotransferase subunit DhaK
MKKLMNAVDQIVREQMQGIALAHPELRISLEPKFVWRADAPLKGKVAVISGGGSGHEPLHTGYVGFGMLTAACPGEIFTSPTPDQILEAAKMVHSGAGVLLLIKNYTGDLLNFETAVEVIHSEGIPVQAVLIDDDVAIKDARTTAGRRGVGTTVVAEKIVGAAAEAGCSLDKCSELARRVNRYGRSMGMALSSCVVPAAGKATFFLAEDEIEIGIGIHGEPGIRRAAIAPADEITEILAEEILGDGAYTRLVREWDRLNGNWIERELVDEPLKAGDELIVLVNSMGGTPISELYAVYRKLHAICEQYKMTIVRNLIGPYITSLDMQGFSITLVKTDAEILKLWDAPVKTAALRWGV